MLLIKSWRKFSPNSWENQNHCSLSYSIAMILLATWPDKLENVTLNYTQFLWQLCVDFLFYLGQVYVGNSIAGFLVENNEVSLLFIWGILHLMFNAFEIKILSSSNFAHNIKCFVELRKFIEQFILLCDLVPCSVEISLTVFYWIFGMIFNPNFY